MLEVNIDTLDADELKALARKICEERPKLGDMRLMLTDMMAMIIYFGNTIINRSNTVAGRKLSNNEFLGSLAISILDNASYAYDQAVKDGKDISKCRLGLTFDADDQDQ